MESFLASEHWMTDCRAELVSPILVWKCLEILNEKVRLRLKERKGKKGCRRVPFDGDCIAGAGLVV